MFFIEESNNSNNSNNSNICVICVICLENLNGKKEEVRRCKVCQHDTHSVCLEKWDEMKKRKELNMTTTCPLCRSVMKPVIINDLASLYHSCRRTFRKYRNYCSHVQKFIQNFIQKNTLLSLYIFYIFYILSMFYLHSPIFMVYKVVYKEEWPNSSSSILPEKYF